MKKEYVYDEVMRSGLTGRFYYVPKAEVLEGGQRRVVGGKKIDITDYLMPFLQERYRPKVKTEGLTRGSEEQTKNNVEREVMRNEY